MADRERETGSGTDSGTGSGAAGDRPVYLLLAAVLVALQGLALLGLAVAEAANLTGSRVALGVTTTVFFAALGAALLGCARGLAQVRSWARSPVVVVELLQLLTAWSFRQGETALLAVGLAVFAAVVLVGVMHPASTHALAADPD